MTGNQTADDARLAQLLRSDLPPERDPLFRIEVLARLERRRFRRQLFVALTSGAVSALRSLVWPQVGRVTRTISRTFGD